MKATPPPLPISFGHLTTAKHPPHTQNPSQTDLSLLEFFRGQGLWQQSVIVHTNTSIFQKKRKMKHLSGKQFNIKY